MTECKKVQSYLSMYFDGQLGSEETKKIEEHVRVCKTCSKVIDDYTAIKNGVQNVEEIAPGEFAFHRIRARIKEEQECLERRWHFIKFSLGTLGLATAGVSLIILLRHSPLVDDRFEIARNLEVLQNMDIIQNLDFYEYLADEFTEDI